MIKNLHTETPNNLQKIGVYTITNILNGKLYVGSTNSSFINRWRQHLKYLRKGNHHSKKLQNAVNKYGIENFKFEILDITEKNYTKGIENYWINLLNPIKFGYNVSYSVNGGCSGYKLTEKHKKIISESQKENKHRLNIKHSKNIKLKIKKSVTDFYKKDNEVVNNLKKKRGEILGNLNKTKINLINKIPIVQIDLLTNNIIKKWDSATDAGKCLNIFATSITKVCRNKSKFAGGFKWAYEKN